MSGPLNIVYLCSWYPSENQATLGNFIQKHAEAVSYQHQVYTISVHPALDHKFKVDCVNRDNLYEVRAYYPKTKNGLLGTFRKYFRWKKALKMAVEFYKTRVQKTDLVHVHVAFPMGLFVQKVFPGIPFVLTEHSSGLHPGPNAYPNWVLKRIMKVFKNAKKVLPVSKNLGQRIHELAQVEFEVIPNVVNASTFNLDSELEKSNRLVHISTAYEAAKNVLGLIRAIKVLADKRQDFEFHIISDGDTTEHKSLAKSLGLIDGPLFFHDTMTTQEIADFLKTCKALVLFSNFENFPCVIPEAWMSGIPVIATAVNGIPEYVNNSNGLLIEPRNERQLTMAMDVMLSRSTTVPEDLRTFAIEHFSYESVAAKLDHVYRDALK